MSRGPLRREWALILAALVITAAVSHLVPMSTAGAAEPLSRDQIYAACAERLAARPSDPWLQQCAAAMAPDPTPSATPSASPTVSPTGLPSTPSPSVTPTGMSTPPPSPTGSPSPPAVAWPTSDNTGVPAGWVPRQTRSTTLTVTTPGAVVEDIRFTNGASLVIGVSGVVVRRVLFEGGKVNNVPGRTCFRFSISEATFLRPTNADGDEPTIKHGGYSADRVRMDGVTEGFRVGGAGSFGCGTTTITNSWVRVQREAICNDWHGDGIQGYDGPALVVRNTVLWLDEQGCGGTAPFFYPRNQGNTSVDIDRLIVRGGGYAFRLGMVGSVRNLKIVNGWGYGPIDVRCSVVTPWQAEIVTVDAAWNPTPIRAQPCNTESGF